MPMTLNDGLRRKAGEPNYSSRGAGISFEVVAISGRNYITNRGDWGLSPTRHH
jgi:hypothetical protein